MPYPCCCEPPEPCPPTRAILFEVSGATGCSSCSNDIWAMQMYRATPVILDCDPDVSICDGSAGSIVADEYATDEETGCIAETERSFRFIEDDNGTIYAKARIYSSPFNGSFGHVWEKTVANTSLPVSFTSSNYKSACSGGTWCSTSGVTITVSEA